VENGNVQGQASVVPVVPTTGSILFADIVKSAGRNLGLAIANLNATPSTITITLRKEDGVLVGTPTTITVEPYKQVAKFVDELFPDNVVGQAFLGSVSLQRGTPFSLLGIRFAGTNFSGITAGNIGTLAVLPTRTLTASSRTDTPRAGAIGGTNALILPQFTLGGGWATHIALVNTSAVSMTGRVDILDTNGQALAVKINGLSQSTFTYQIPPGGTFVLAPRDQNGQTPM
jgi:hypothetical protein